ncbi:MAG: FAD-binding oxidoreductase [Thermoanaerobaculia bacterium]
MAAELDRRAFLRAAGLLAFSGGCAGSARLPRGAAVVNDVHSQLNATRVERVIPVDSVAAVRRAIRDARRRGRSVAISGGRHAMGGQQFAEDALLLDVRPMRRILGLDAETGIVDVESGIEWPALVSGLISRQDGRARPWGIAQKQTGADRLTLGGALAANAHGRGLTMKPFIRNVESFVLVDGAGQVRRCSRTENAELFRLAIGGYGLFGVVTSLRLRLVPRRKLERIVEVTSVRRLAEAFAQRIQEGFLYGDMQFAIDERSEDFLRRGVLACYRPVGIETPIPAGQRELSEGEWGTLIRMAHSDKTRAFDAYVRHYLATSGQIYWSDAHQLSTYLDDYHRSLDPPGGPRATEMITEVYVPRSDLSDFMEDARQSFRAHGTPVVYGTIRLIERDDESFLAWARRAYACVIFNLHLEHSPAGLERGTEAFRRLIDLAIDRGGSYFLTYHRWATRRQVEACYPQMPAFLAAKRRYDPQERFQSDWYRHYRRMFGG